MIHAILLGNAQDAGLPQAGCDCANCRRAWSDPALRRSAAALGLVDTQAGQAFLIDATPDFREQLQFLRSQAPAAKLAGILLTHAHIGHYSGLIHLGYEAMNTRELPVYATVRMLDFLRNNAPWRMLIERGNISPRPLVPGEWYRLSPALAVQALPVPHRDEASDTVAFLLRGPQSRLLYLPDIDAWEQWQVPLRDFVAELYVALLDATFFSPDELPRRDAAGIGHPFATDTAERLAGLDCDVRLIHLNHSNPLHYDGPERQWLAARGLRVGEPGARWEL